MKKNYIILLLLTFVYSAQSQTITTVAGTGSSGFGGDGGPATTAKLNLPFNLTFDKSDNIYIADTYNNSIRRIDSESGIITTVVGTADKKQVSELKTPTGCNVLTNSWTLGSWEPITRFKCFSIFASLGTIWSLLKL